MTPGWANKKIRKEIEGEASNQNEPQHAPCAIYIYISRTSEARSTKMASGHINKGSFAHKREVSLDLISKSAKAWEHTG